MRDVSETEQLRGLAADERRAAALPASLPLKRARTALQTDQELLYRDAARLRFWLLQNYNLQHSVAA
ncbi:MAG: hypothetical protein JWL65_2940 [Gammaproteobacteria bacterium]|nr:hypothetical protein [Gammaproteobacteria bacterium]